MAIKGGVLYCFLS